MCTAGCSSLPCAPGCPPGWPSWPLLRCSSPPPGCVLCWSSPPDCPLRRPCCECGTSRHLAGRRRPLQWPMGSGRGAAGARQASCSIDTGSASVQLKPAHTTPGALQLQRQPPCHHGVREVRGVNLVGQWRRPRRHRAAEPVHYWRCVQPTAGPQHVPLPAWRTLWSGRWAPRPRVGGRCRLCLSLGRLWRSPQLWANGSLVLDVWTQAFGLNGGGGGSMRPQRSAAARATK